jgi:hypothetical protein
MKFRRVSLVLLVIIISISISGMQPTGAATLLPGITKDSVVSDDQGYEIKVYDYNNKEVDELNRSKSVFMFKVIIFQPNGTAVESGKLNICIFNSKQDVCFEHKIDIWHAESWIGVDATSVKWEPGEYRIYLKYYNKKGDALAYKNVPLHLTQ